MSAEDFDGCVVRLRGLPWSATAEEVLKFLDDIAVVGGENGVHFTYSREGRPSGECFIELVDESNLQKALQKNNEHMGNRYIEVFRSKKSEMEWVIKRAGPGQMQGTQDAVVRLRGLPFGCSKEEIAQFFTGLEIVPNGIMLPEDRQGRSTGDAYVQFASPDLCEKALLKHKERIGHRYIEIFKSSLNEAYGQINPSRSMIRPLMSGSGMGGGGGGGMNRPSPYDRAGRFGMGSGMGMGGGGGSMGYGMGRGGRNVKGFFEEDFDDFGSGYGSGMGGFSSRGRRGGMGGMGGSMRPSRGGGLGLGSLGAMRQRGATPGSHYVSKTGHSVHMRGLPFQALDTDIAEFFSPLGIKPVSVEVEYGPNGRPTGEANVDFAGHQEAVEAMKNHKKNMQHRYIELFLNSTQTGKTNYGSGGGFGGSSSSSGGFGDGGFNNGGGFGDGYDGGYGDTMSGGGGGGMMGGGSGSMGGGGMGSGMGGGYGGGPMGGGGMGGMGNPNYTAF
ncbi:heterogeneous nuclear ribonucleoprotein F/H [Mytilus galloprovincialis]|nr:heterogeneous nuclear ribonucleoprotein F/H [Mytilus galloprovincialis]